MRVRNREMYLKWKKNNMDDGYGFDIFAFSEKWANLMEEEIEQGNSLENIVESTADLAGRSEISNTMFESALNILIKCWVFGYELEVYFKKKNRGIFGEEV